MSGIVLEFQPEPTPPRNLPAFPHGHWYARTAKGGYDGVGETPEQAVAQLAAELARALGEDG